MMGDGLEKPNTGATLEPVYHKHEQDIVGVPVMEIHDMIPAIREEVIMSSTGGFFASGSFWLGLERLFTVGPGDALFLSCIAFLVCGLVLMVIGIRQGLRRMCRLQRYLPGQANNSGKRLSIVE